MTAISAARPARGPPAPKLYICKSRVAENSIHPAARCGHFSCPRHADTFHPNGEIKCSPTTQRPSARTS